MQLWGTAADDLWARTLDPWGVFHWDGSRWTDRSGAIGDQIVTGIGGTADHVYAVGGFGVVRWHDGAWQDVYRVEVGGGPVRFRSVCATRTRVFVTEGQRTWVRPLPE